MIAVGKWSGALLCGAAVLVSAHARAGSVLVVKGPNSAPFREALDGFRQACPGGVESERRDLPRRLQSDQPSLIVAFGRDAAEAARQQASETPLLFLMVANPAASGLTGKNIVGISTQIRGDVQLARLKELFPGKKSVAIIHNPATSGRTVQEAEAAARKLDVHIEDVPVNSPNEVRDRFDFIKPIVEAIWIIPDEEIFTLASVWEYLREQSNRAGLALIITNGERAVAEGALAALMPDYRDLGRQGGELARQIASGGKKVDDLGVLSAQTARVVINTKTARKLGLSFSREILQSAKTYP